MLNRRQFLGASVALSGLSSWSVMANQSTPNTQLFASAFSLNKDQHFFSLFDEEGRIAWQQALPERAHAPIIHANKALIGVVARRPGFYIDLFDINSGNLIQRITPAKDHHFYGHGLFSHDGKFLITQENHYPSGKGKIFIPEIKTGNIVNAFPSYGIGPHESVLMGENILVVANGGLKTHPDNDRKILNLEDMQANLAFISLETGKLIHKLVLPKHLHQLSIRHLDINQAGKVALGFQYQGNKWDDVPLIATASISSASFELLNLPSDINRRLNQYCGSVTFDQSGDILAVSSPRGDLIVYWDMKQDKYLSHHNFQDVCGLAQTNKDHQFLLTTGKGKRVYVNPVSQKKQSLASLPKWKWDNHLHQINV